MTESTLSNHESDKKPPISVGRGLLRKRFSKRFLVYVSLALLLIALVVGVGVHWWQKQAEYKRLAAPKSVNETVADAQDHTLSGDYASAKNTIKDALENPRLSEQSKQNLLMQQAVIYLNEKNYQAAMDIYRQVEAIQSTSGVVLAIAELAYLMEDKELSLDYYQKALGMLDKDNPMYDEHKRNIENRIILLQGGEPVYDQEN